MSELKPLFPYAGGKGGLLKHFSSYLQKSDTYVEPFFGAGSVYCYMRNYNLARRYIVNDLNPELISMYRGIKDDAETVVDEVKEIEQAYMVLEKRDRGYKFTAEVDAYNKAPTAGRLLFLLNTSFGCMWARHHITGNFNPESGHNKIVDGRDSIVSEYQIRQWHKALQQTEMLCGDYRKIIVPDNTTVFCDPPYLDVQRLYYESFDNQDQVDCFNWCNELSENASITVVHTNGTDGRFFEKLLKSAPRANSQYYKAHHSSSKSAKAAREILMVWNEKT